MYPASFEYHRAASVADALALMEKYGDDAKVLAGGHSLLPVMKLRFASPGHLIDIGRIGALQGVSEAGGVVTIGALARHAEVAAFASGRRGLGALADAASAIGDVQVRNRGTIGGSVAHADPGADLPAALLALAADIVVTGKGGERIITADQYFVDTFTTSMKTGELVTQVRIKVPAAGTGTAYVKYADAASGYAVVGVAACVTVAGGKVTAARVAMTGMGPKAMRLSGVESALNGQPATEAGAKSATADAAKGLDLYDDARGSASYKAALVSIHSARAIVTAIGRAGA
ncbi:MAG: xanthine dehydrogenase family protein subunit M [Gemmatimonadaceae bacterium]